MRPDAPSNLLITYCLNIHPGESFKDVSRNIKRYSLAIRNRVSPGKPFGLGLRLSAEAAADLKEHPLKLEAFKEMLDAENLFVFTLNGFPYGAFHGTRIKEEVYAPDWCNSRRVAYTKNLAEILAYLLPDSMEGSISTVPVSWKPWILSEDRLYLAIENLSEMAFFLSRLEARTGKTIHLGLEMEPTCYLETSEEAIKFFNSQLFERGAGILATRQELRKKDAEKMLRRHIGVCVDTCHMALAFEDPGNVLKKFAIEQIRISKIQVSSALEGQPTPETLEALEAFAEPTYLHQVAVRTTEGTVLQWRDLPEALEALQPPKKNYKTIRVHYHVPLSWEGHGPLGTTISSLSPLFWSEVNNGICQHVEIETYTYEVLPESVKTASVVNTVAEEFYWLSQYI